jgi:hypothetical protein
MKKSDRRLNSGDMRVKYDFSGGVRGKYAQSFAKGTNLMAIDPELAKIYKNSQAVNRALRLLAELARGQTKRSAG